MVELKERLIHQKSAVSMMNMNRKVSLHVATTTAAFFFMTSSLVRGQTAQTSPASMARGDEAMGFDQEKTTHHFKLTPNGGAIEVEANDSNDASSRDQIRHHLGMIREMFAAGDFSKPFEVHAQAPPGVEDMTTLLERATPRKAHS